MRIITSFFALFICFFINAQTPEEVEEYADKAESFKTKWRARITGENNDLKKKVASILDRMDMQSELITQLEIKQIVDSLKIDRLERQIRYTQTFIKDSLQIVSDPIIESNLLGELDYYHAGWEDNLNGVYYYDASVNYKYLIFNLKEPLQVDDEYNITFTIEGVTGSRRALLGFWAYPDNDDGSDVDIETPSISRDIYYENGDHEYQFVVEGRNRATFAVRARNNDGGAFTIKNIKILKL